MYAIACGCEDCDDPEISLFDTGVKLACERSINAAKELGASW